MLQHEIIVRSQNAAHSPYFFKAIIFHNNLSRIVLCNFCISLEIDNDITVVMRTRYEHVTFCFRMNVLELSMRCVGSIFQIEGTTIVM